MTTSPAPLPDEPDNDTTADTSQRPALHLVNGLDDIEVPEDTTPDAPLAYRINSHVADLAARMPGMWSERLPSFEESLRWVQDGDWTISNAARTANLIAFLFVCLPLGFAATFLLWLSRKPSRAGIAIGLWLLVSYALS